MRQRRTECRIVSFVIVMLALAAWLISACARQAATPVSVPTLTRRPTLVSTVIVSAAPTLASVPTRTKRPAPHGLPDDGSLGDMWIRPADGMVLVFVPGGTFKMGTKDGDPYLQSDEAPQHAVSVSSFWIDRTEVTNAQYALCVAAGACQPPFEPLFERHADYFSNSDYAGFPVIYVSWLHGHEFCTWAGGGLPTEAQWEYAARGAASSRYPWGDEAPGTTLLNFDNNVNDTVAVGSYPAGASWVGAMDMAGNVYEWVADWYGRYDAKAQSDPFGPGRGIGHVLRGGSWQDGTEFVRSANRYVIREAYRDYTVPSGHGFNLGFRCAITP